MTEDAPEEKKETKTEEELPSSATKAEKVEERATPVVFQVKRPRVANPYGAWERIKQEEDP